MWSRVSMGKVKPFPDVEEGHWFSRAAYVATIKAGSMPASILVG